MVRRVKKVLSSFRSKILISFFAFSCVLLVWVAGYLFIAQKYRQVQAFTNSLAQTQRRHFEGVGSLQYFMLAGFHQPSFYATYHQEHIDEFLRNEELIIERLCRLQTDTVARHIRIHEQLQRIIHVHERLLSYTRKLKETYHRKGFKDYGQEGLMRTYAHFIEDSGIIDRPTILQLRRYEKDYLLRGERNDVDEFNIIIDRKIAALAFGSATKNALINYKTSFNLLVSYIDQLGINTNSGVYGKVQNTIQDLDLMYNVIDNIVASEVVRLNMLFKDILITGTAILVLIAIGVSIVLSGILTKEVKDLQKNVIRFIRSRFADDTSSLDRASYRTAEIEMLNRSFTLLVTTLKNTLTDLELAINEEKRISADLADTIVYLQNKMVEIEQQKEEIKMSEAKLEARNTALLRIAHIQSHHIRGPLATIMGLANIIIHENSFNQEYMMMLKEALHLLDERIIEIVNYTKEREGNLYTQPGLPQA